MPTQEPKTRVIVKPARQLSTEPEKNMSRLKPNTKTEQGQAKKTGKASDDFMAVLSEMEQEIQERRQVLMSKLEASKKKT